MTDSSPRTITRALEAAASLPDSPDRERLRGYAVTGLPFRSGHVLAMRRFPATSFGRPYTSVWHRNPAGRWVIYQDQPPQFSCPRAFGPAIEAAPVVPIAIDWTAPDEFAISIDTDEIHLRWHIPLISSSLTRAINAAATVVPTAVRHSQPFLAAVGRATGPLLKAGRVRLAGRVPSEKRFFADLRKIWLVGPSTAAVDGTDLGEPGSLPEQPHLGDFWIPQRGIFAIADAFFEPIAADEVPQLTRSAASVPAS